MKLLFLAILLHCGLAFAEPYVIIGVGQGKLHNTHTNGLWYQEGFDHISAENSPVWKLGLGLKLNSWLSAEADYRDLGQFNSHALWVGDSNYNPQTKTCNTPCDKLSAGWQHGTTKGIGLSLVASPDWTVAPLLRLGKFYHRSSFTTSILFPGQPTFNSFTNDGTSNFSENKFGYMGGLGVRWRGFEIEYTYYPKVAQEASPYQNISTIMLSAVVRF